MAETPHRPPMQTSPPIHNPTVANLTAAELFEAAVAAMAGAGFEEGRWQFELRVEEGQVRRLRAVRLGVSSAVTLGRSELTRKSAA